MTEQLIQTAPYPDTLARLVHQLTYRPGWKVELRDFERDPGSRGLTLVVTTCTHDSYHPERGSNYRVDHFFPVPPATYAYEDWRRWLFDRLVDVETHEAAEFFQIGVNRPYAPNHGPGRNPYIVVEYRDDVDRRTRFTGEVVSGHWTLEEHPGADRCMVEFGSRSGGPDVRHCTRVANHLGPCADLYSAQCPHTYEQESCRLPVNHPGPHTTDPRHGMAHTDG